ATFGWRRADFEQIDNKPSLAVEILGSTETGGVAYSNLFDLNCFFSPLPGVTLRVTDDKTYIYSPFIDGEQPIIIGDHFEQVDAKYFIHRGRSDRIFKYKSKRL